MNHIVSLKKLQKKNYLEKSYTGNQKSSKDFLRRKKVLYRRSSVIQNLY